MALEQDSQKRLETWLLLLDCYTEEKNNHEHGRSGNCVGKGGVQGEWVDEGMNEIKDL